MSDAPDAYDEFLPDVLGGPLATVIAHQCPDIQVTVVDKNKERIDAWNTGIPPLYEPGLEAVLSSVRQRETQCNLTFSTDIDQAIREAEIIMLCIDTLLRETALGKGWHWTWPTRRPQSGP